MNGEWKDVKEFEGLYEVSNTGAVRNKRKKTLLKPHTNTSGYLQVELRKNGKTVFKCVHRLVAEAFVDNPLQHTEVNHIDENKMNNSVANLQWCSHRENILHGTCLERARKTRQDRYPPRKVLAIFPDGSTHCYKSVAMASAELGIKESCIRVVLCGNRLTHLGIRWMYMDK